MRLACGGTAAKISNYFPADILDHHARSQKTISNPGAATLPQTRNLIQAIGCGRSSGVD
jgi:hypothetical protein